MLEVFVPSFPLCMESNALEKSTNISVALRIFCMYPFDDLTNSQNLRSCGWISPKTILIFPKNFLNFRSDRIEKQGIINLSSCNSKS